MGRTIRKAYIDAPGDPSVGIFAQIIEVKFNRGGGIEVDDDIDLEAVRSILEALGAILGEEVSVQFDFELAAEEKAARRSDRERQIDEGHPDVTSIWDNGGKTVDRYTVFIHDPTDAGFALGLSDNPESPLGFSQSMAALPKPGAHLGKRIDWQKLPRNVREHIISRIGEV